MHRQHSKRALASGFLSVKPCTFCHWFLKRRSCTCLEKHKHQSEMSEQICSASSQSLHVWQANRCAEVEPVGLIVDKQQSREVLFGKARDIPVDAITEATQLYQDRAKSEESEWYQWYPDVKVLHQLWASTFLQEFQLYVIRAQARFRSSFLYV